VKCRKVVIMAILILIYAVLFTYYAQAQFQQVVTSIKGQDTAVETLRHYLQLRLRNADWKDYSKYVTWSDEPSWDCNWVVRNYDIGMPKKGKHNVVVPVVYKRLGLFCYDFDFSPDLKIVTIKYELVKHRSGWKVNAPVPDYPDISADVLIKSLRASAESSSESQDRRAQFSASACKLSDVLDRAGNSKQ